MPHRNRFPLFILAASFVAFTVGNPCARAATVSPACKPVIDAMNKQLATPTHLYVVEPGESKDGAPATHEQIYAGTAIYIRENGKWSRSPMTLQQMVQQQQENIRNAKSLDCRHLRDEAVDSENAAVYSEDSVNEDTRSGGQIWISKSRGLPLKSAADIDLGGSDKEHISIRYDYSNVQAPAGVK